MGHSSLKLVALSCCFAYAATFRSVVDVHQIDFYQMQEIQNKTESVENVHRRDSEKQKDSQDSAHRGLALSTSFPLGAAFKAHLKGNARTAGLVPGSYPINPDKYAEWKSEAQANMRVVQKELGDLRHVPFEEFAQEFIAQMGNVEKLLNLVEFPRRCHLSYFRMGAGISVNDTSKSFGWMGRLFTELLYWDQPGAVPTLLKECWERTGRAITQHACQNARGENWNSIEDIVLSIEDVSYSGTELFSTADTLMKCPTLPRVTVFATAFISSPVNSMLQKTKIRLTNLACPTTETRSVEAYSMDGCLLLPLDLVSKSQDGVFDCPTGIASDEYPEACWIYFDHKMADAVALSEANLLAAQGAVFSADCYQSEEWDSNDTACKNYQRIIPYVTGCERVHECAVQHYIGGQSDCADNLQCPFSPYKNHEKMEILLGRCCQ